MKHYGSPRQGQILSPSRQELPQLDKRGAQPEQAVLQLPRDRGPLLALLRRVLNLQGQTTTTTKQQRRQPQQQQQQTQYILSQNRRKQSWGGATGTPAYKAVALIVPQKKNAR